MKWYNPILAPDSLWLVWAGTDMSKYVDILTLTPDSLWAQVSPSVMGEVVAQDEVMYCQKASLVHSP